MNEQRLQAYYQLIESLLSCPSGEESRILAANQELLDTGFVQMLTAVAEHFAQEGEENTANRLRNLATHLTPETTPITEEDIETYGGFLQEVLQATADSNGDAEVIYPLLTANTDKLNPIFAQLLQLWATNTLAEAEADAAEFIAYLMVILGNGISNFPLGSKADNMEIAITGYEIALRVYTPTAFPIDWAMTQNNLGIAYLYRIFGERAQNLELAIAAHNDALSVYTRTAFPIDWAMTQTNLGNAYSERIFGDRAQNLELAIAAYNHALSVYTRTAFPIDWAMTQNNLGEAYRERIFGERAQNLELAIAAFNHALSVRTRTAFPQENAETLANLGMLYQDKTQQFDLAYNTFAKAITTVESLRGEINSGEEAKRKQAEEWNHLYSRMVEVCLGLGRKTEAIEYIERSKTRNLVELIFQGDLKTIFPLELVTKIEELNDKIARNQYQLQNNEANPITLAQDIQKWRQQRQDLQDRYLPVGSNFKFEQFLQTLDDNTAIIEWYIVSDSILTFIIQPHGQKLTFRQSSPADRKALFDCKDAYLQDYYNSGDTKKIQWHNQLETRLKQLSEILHLEEIIAQFPPECERLILIPHRFLHLFPLHTLPVNQLYLMDLFPKGVGYAPSCQILQQVQLRQRPDFQSLFVIQNPTEDLYQPYENDLGAVAAIKQQFADVSILKQTQAKKSAIIQNQKFRTANSIFCFCHGYFNPNFPLDSGLLLADCFVSSDLVEVEPKRYLPSADDENKTIDLKKCLTLTDIITHIKLEKCRLVTLSACETGMTDPTNTSDEYIGLPSGFLLAGSTNVVSSLWTVNATATALLMIKFFKELKQQDNITLALNTAQRWLRNITVQELRTWLRQSNLDDDWQDELDQEFAQIQQTQGETTKIFASPAYWSAFCTIGKGY